MDMVYCSSSSSTASSSSTSSSYSSPPTPPATMPSTRAPRSSFSSSSSEKPLWRDIASRKYSLQQAQDALEAGVQSFAGSHSDDRAPDAVSYREALLLDDLTAWSLGQGSSTQVQSTSPRLSAQPQWTIVNPFGNSVTNDDTDESTSDESRHALHRSSVSPSWLDHDDDDDTSISTSARTSSPPLFPFKRDSRCPAVIATSPSPPRATAASSSASSSSASVREAARALFALSSEAERQEAMELAAQWKREETRMGRLSFQVGKAAKQQQQQQPVRQPLAQAQPQRQSMPQPQAPAPARPQRRTKAASLPPLLQPPPPASLSRSTAAAAARATSSSSSSSTAQVVPTSPLPDSSRSSSDSNRARSLSMLDSVANELALMSEMARSQSWCEVSTPRSRSPSPLMWAVGHSHQERRLSMAGVATVMMSS